MRRIFRPLRRPLRAAGPLTVSVMPSSSFPPLSGVPTGSTRNTCRRWRPPVLPAAARRLQSDLSIRPRGRAGSIWLSVARGPDVVVLVMASPQRGDFLLEVVQRLEAPVDRGEPEVRDLVEVPEWPEDRQSHLVGWHLRQTA